MTARHAARGGRGRRAESERLHPRQCGAQRAGRAAAFSGSAHARCAASLSPKAADARELAAAIASRENPLTARVLVNRIWGLFFGQPLVATPSNFGHSGALPTHPELLDDLAVRFMENGWSIKWLAREIALSATYRQDSRIARQRRPIPAMWRSAG